jgi:hypothetical protein
LKNIFEEGELLRDSVVAQNATTAADGKSYQVDYDRLEAVLAVSEEVLPRNASWLARLAKGRLRSVSLRVCRRGLETKN